MDLFQDTLPPGRSQALIFPLLSFFLSQKVLSDLE